MGIPPHRFWRLSLAEWRGMLTGYAQRLKWDRRAQAWTVSHLLIAAGCDADNVTPAKLLGEKERKRKVKAQPDQLPIDEIWRKMRGEE